MEESGGQPRKFYQASLPEMAKTMKQLAESFIADNLGKILLWF